MSVAWMISRSFSASVTRVAPQILDPRPQPDVHRRRVLRLQATHRVERGRQVQRTPLEQPLTSKDRPVELTLAELHTVKRSTRAGAALPAASRTRTVSV